MSTALNIFNRSHALRSIYLLREAARGPIVTPDEAAAGHFLLWMAVFGRKLYQGVVIDADFFDYVTGPTGNYLTRIEMFVDMLRGSGPRRGQADMLLVHYWYYVHGIQDFNLEIFVTPRELTALASIIPFSDRTKDLSLMEKVSVELSHLPDTVFGTEDYKRTRPASGNHESIGSSWLTMRTEARPCPSVGVNLIGYANGVLGIGEDIRTSARALGRAGVPFSIVNVKLPEEVTSLEQTDLSGFFVDRPVFPVNLFCMTLFETERIRMEFGLNMFGARYNIGYWPWELPALPPLWHHAFDHVDEIWAISPYLVDVFSKCTDKPVTLMPSGLAIGSVAPFDLSTLGIEPETFVFLTMLDFNSFMSRKNPIGAIDAFKLAFPRQSGSERLIIKSINGDAHADEFDRLLEHVGSDSRILVVDGAYSRESTNGLIAAVDCLISLHRAEGLGRVIGEAMLLNTPVVATDWSGSTSLMDDSTGFPVTYVLKSVPPGDYLFEDGCRWAEPSVEDAAKKLRLVRRDSALVKRKCVAARSRIMRDHGLEAVATRMADRLDQIASGWGINKVRLRVRPKRLKRKRERL